MKKTNTTTITHPYRIRMVLQEKRTAEFTYSDRHMARGHFDFLRTVGLVGDIAIREITFEDLNDKP